MLRPLSSTARCCSTGSPREQPSPRVRKPVSPATVPPFKRYRQSNAPRSYRKAQAPWCLSRAPAECFALLIQTEGPAAGFFRHRSRSVPFSLCLPFIMAPRQIRLTMLNFSAPPFSSRPYVSTIQNSLPARSSFLQQSLPITLITQLNFLPDSFFDRVFPHAPMNTQHMPLPLPGHEPHVLHANSIQLPVELRPPHQRLPPYA